MGVYDPPTDLTRMGQRLFDLLPEYVRESDSRYELARLMGVIGDAMAPVVVFVDAADPDTSATGTCEPVNPATAPAGWLPWLGWLVGIPVGGLSVSDARWYLSRAGAQSHGSSEGMRAAVQATLTGTRDCEVFTHVGGDPWAMEVLVSSACLVDAELTYRAAMREKPAGVTLDVLSSDRMTYAELKAAYGTFGDMKATGLTYRELKFA